MTETDGLIGGVPACCGDKCLDPTPAMPQSNSKFGTRYCGGRQM